MSFQLSLSTESVSAAYPDQPLFVTPAATVGEVIQLLRAQQTGSVLVCDSDSGSLLGIFTERDALKCMAAVSGERWRTSRTADQATGQNVMDQPVSDGDVYGAVTLEANTSMGEAIKMMSQGNYRHLPIVDAGLSRRAWKRFTALSTILSITFLRPFTTCLPIRAREQVNVKAHNEELGFGVGDCRRLGAFPVGFSTSCPKEQSSARNSHS